MSTWIIFKFSGSFQARLVLNNRLRNTVSVFLAETKTPAGYSFLPPFFLLIECLLPSNFFFSNNFLIFQLISCRHFTFVLCLRLFFVFFFFY